MPQADPAPSGELAIFPLGTVLFPQGVLPLRVFEARYVDMVRECMRHDQPFGVCLITRGAEVGKPAEHESVGCTARIVDWDQAAQGVLGIRTIGGQRFRILSRRVQPDGLIRGHIEPIADDAAIEVAPEHRVCVELLHRIVDDIRSRSPDPHWLAEPLDFNSSGWVSNRLCECLPLPPATKQRLMALADPAARLALVHEFLRKGGILDK